MVLWYLSRSVISVLSTQVSISCVCTRCVINIFFLVCAWWYCAAVQSRNDSNTESHNQTLPNQGCACRVCRFSSVGFLVCWFELRPAGGVWLSVCPLLDILPSTLSLHNSPLRIWDHPGVNTHSSTSWECSSMTSAISCRLLVCRPSRNVKSS